MSNAVELQAEINRLREVNALLTAYRALNERLLAAESVSEVATAAVSALAELLQAEGGALLLAGEGGASQPLEYHPLP